MAILHKIADKDDKNSMPAKGLFTEETWQLQRPAADALLRLLRACLVTGTWIGISAGKKSGGIKVSIRNKGIGADEWYETAEQIHEVAKEVEELVEHAKLLEKFLSFPAADAPKGYKPPRPGSVDEYEQAI